MAVGTNNAESNNPIRSMRRASTRYSLRRKYHAPVAATHEAPVKYEARSMCGKRTQTTGLNRIAAQSVGTNRPLTEV
jgi:hypothetical protein